MNKLSQDLTDMFDEEPKATPETDVQLEDMFEEQTPEPATEETTAEEPTETESTEENPEETESTKENPEETESTEESTEEADIAELEKLLAEIETSSADSEENVQEVKGTIEDVQKALSEEDMGKVESLVNDLYAQILTYESDIEVEKTKYEVLRGKFEDIKNKYEDASYKIEEATATKVSTDPQMRVLNRMFDDAVGGSKAAKDKVGKLLEDMYYKVTSENLEDKIVENSVKEGSETKVVGDTTNYDYETPPEDDSLQEGILGLY